MAKCVMCTEMLDPVNYVNFGSSRVNVKVVTKLKFLVAFAAFKTCIFFDLRLVVLSSGPNFNLLSVILLTYLTGRGTIGTQPGTFVPRPQRK